MFRIYKRYVYSRLHPKYERDYRCRCTLLNLAISTICLSGCGSGPGSVIPPLSPPANSNASIQLSSPSLALLGGQSVKFTATVRGGTSGSLDWMVDQVVGGTASTGLISSDGSYTAPVRLNGTINIGVRLHQDTSIASSLPIKVIAPTPVDGQISFTFSLPGSAQTSAGIYDSTMHLVRTLWSNQTLSVGPHLGVWDGLDDLGMRVSPAQYQIRLLYNNVSYEWGVIGDTSGTLAGPDNWDSQGTFPMDAAIDNNTVVTADGYAEGRPNASTFQAADPQSPQALFNLGQNVELDFAATDGNLAYFGNVGNGWSGSVAFVLAYNVTSGKPYNFPDGSKVPYGSSSILRVLDLDSSAATLTGTNRINLPTGLAVQRSGRLLAVSHGAYTMRDSSGTSLGEDQISLFDKTSGAIVGKIRIHDPQRLAFAANGDLWVISGTQVVRLSSVGFANNIVIRLQGINNPLALAVDPSTDDVLVADGGTSQQIKRFSSDGRLILSYGQLGGYTDCNPTVTTDRLYLDATAGAGAGNQQPGTWLTVGDDSSFWVGDRGNDRALHISASGNYLGQFSFLPMIYAVTVDHGDPTRIFADLLEYKVDYSKDLVPGDPDPATGGNGSWALAKNWSVCLPSQYTSSMSRVQTLSNGRTYAELFNSHSKSQVSGGYLLELAELPSSGPVRPSGQILADGGFNKYIDDDGDLAYWKNSQTTTSMTLTAYKQAFLGLDPNGFPIWANPRIIGSVTSKGIPSRTNEPYGFGGWGMSTFPKATENGYLITYKTSIAASGTAFHLGGLPVGGSDWSWKTSRGGFLATPDYAGTFPETNSYGGHNGIAALVEGSNVIEGYDGQYGSFSSQWMQWQEDGLLVGQFGHPANGYAPNGTLFPGAAGNIAQMASVTVGNDVYLYNSDESYHPGVHRWKISNLESIHEVSAVVALGQTATLK